MTVMWETEELFLNGDEYFRRIIEDIEQAKSLITLEFYIFNDDVLGKAIAEILIEAVQRGVTVQIIVDGVGSHNFIQRIYPRMIAQGVKIKIYNPLPFLHPFSKHMTLLQKFQAIFMRMWRMNRRDHRKIITIDENIMYAGSYNITAEHTRLLGQTAWKDMGLRVTGTPVKYALLNFKRGWKIRDYFQYRKLHKKNLPNWKSTPICLNSTIFMKRHYQKQFRKHLTQAKERAWFMTPYFIPHRKFIVAMAKAAKRGLDVRLILSTKSDVELFLWLQKFYYPFLLKSGVKIYLYGETVLHAKTYIIDDWMTIGSSNLNHRSLMHDLEVDLVVQEEENHKRVEADFLNTMKSMIPLTQADLAKYSILDKVLTRIFFLFRYWL